MSRLFETRPTINQEKIQTARAELDRVAGTIAELPLDMRPLRNYHELSFDQAAARISTFLPENHGKFTASMFSNIEARGRLADITEAGAILSWIANNGSPAGEGLEA